MRWIKKNILLIILFLVALFSLELWREQIVYRRASRALEQGLGRLGNEMSREEVKKILSEPHDAWSNELGESWYWTARNYQGAVWGLLGLNTMMGHYEIVITFEEHSKATRIYSGVN